MRLYGRHDAVAVAGSTIPLLLLRVCCFYTISHAKQVRSPSEVINSENKRKRKKNCRGLRTWNRGARKSRRIEILHTTPLQADGRTGAPAGQGHTVRIRLGLHSGQYLVGAGPVGGIESQQAFEQLVELGRQIGTLPPLVLETFPVGNLGTQLVDVLEFFVDYVGALVRQTAEAEEVEDHAQGEDVGFRGEVSVATRGVRLEDFGGAVGYGAGGSGGFAHDVLGLNLAKVADEARGFAAFSVEKTVAGLEIAVDVVGGVEVGQAAGDVAEQGVNLFKGEIARRQQADAGLFGLSSGPPAHLLLEVFLGGLPGPIANDVIQEVAAVAVLLQDEGACHPGTKPTELDVFEPDVAVGDEVGVGELGEKFDFGQD